jgi:hypothetical protein
MTATTIPIRRETDRPAERAGRLRIHIVWAQLAALAAIVLVLPLGREVDPDFWWHLRTGKLILHAGIPRHDIFSFTASGHSWVTHEWLSEIIIYVVQSAFGYAGNVLLFGAATLVALGLMYALGRRAGAGTRPLVALLLVATVNLAYFVTVRPQVFTWLLFAAFVYVLERHERGERAPLWLLPPLMALWANLHLGYVYGLLTLGVWLAAKLWEHARGADVRLREPIAVTIACVLATMLNPHGPAILTYPVSYFFAGKTERSLIQEWQRPYFGLTVMWPLLVATVLIVLSLLSRNRPRPFLIVLSIIAIALSTQAARNIPFAALLLVPIAGATAAARWPAARREADSHVRVSIFFAAALAIGVGAFTLTMSSHLHSALSGWQPSSATYPARSVAYLDEHAPSARVFNSYDWGGYLIDNLYPDGRVFIDGRADVYGPGLVRDYVAIAMAKPGWQDLLDRYQVDAVLMPPRTRLSVALRQDTGWQEVLMDHNEDLFLRR